MDLRNSVVKEVQDRIFPFWSNLRDNKNGGFYGRVDFSLEVHKRASKGTILNARELYFFAEYFKMFGDPRALSLAEHAFSFLKDNAYDKVNGGVFWSLNSKGKPLDTTKHTYNQAFQIYALSSYYEASGNVEALELAKELFLTIEMRCREKEGNHYYIEAQSLKFNPVKNTKLSENGVMATRTMNTALHLLEAYTRLYSVCPSKEVGESLKGLLLLFENKIYNPSKNRLEVFFDQDYNPIIDMESYGHEIEASYLLVEAAAALGNKEIEAEIAEISKKLAMGVYKRAYEKPFIYNEIVKGAVDKTRVWWIEAEGVTGFLNLASLTNDDSWEKVSEELFEGIEKYFIDTRQGGCWFWDLDENNVPSSRKDIVEPWKCPYHNGRMCFEVYRRLSK